MFEIDDFSHSQITQVLNSVEIVILKLGTSLLTSSLSSEEAQGLFFTELTHQVKLLKEQGKKVIIISSGAVGLGRETVKKCLDFVDKDLVLKSILDKQGLAAIGQVELMEMYCRYFREKNLLVSQILLTRSDFENYKSYKNLHSTLHLLLRWGVIPIINENDVLSNEELQPLGDNDTLLSFVTTMFRKAMSIIFTNVDGFYVNKKLVVTLSSISPDLKKEAGEPSDGGTGGMITKLLTAEYLLERKKTLFLTKGDNLLELSKLFSNKTMKSYIYNIKGTWFIPK